MVYSKGTLVNKDHRSNETTLEFSVTGLKFLNSRVSSSVFLTVYSDWSSGDNIFARCLDRKYDGVPILETIGLSRSWSIVPSLDSLFNFAVQQNFRGNEPVRNHLEYSSLVILFLIFRTHLWLLASTGDLEGRRMRIAQIYVCLLFYFLLKVANFDAPS